MNNPKDATLPVAANTTSLPEAFRPDLQSTISRVKRTIRTALRKRYSKSLAIVAAELTAQHLERSLKGHERAFISKDGITAVTGLSRSTVGRHLALLTSMGVTSTTGKCKGGMRRAADRRINWKQLETLLTYCGIGRTALDRFKADTAFAKDQSREQAMGCRDV